MTANDIFNRLPVEVQDEITGYRFVRDKEYTDAQRFRYIVIGFLFALETLKLIRFDERMMLFNWIIEG